MNKVMGLDLGSRTIGIALSDVLGMIAHGLETYRFQPECYQEALNHVVEIGERAQISIRFKEMLLEARPHLNVVLSDERLTTKVAEQSLIFADVSRKKRKKVIDKMAAVNILQGYLDSH